MQELYANIKRLREEKGMSQVELARRTGYTDRSSIAKIESGKVDLYQSKVELFAKALGTTPRALMGWTDEPQDIHPVSLKRIPMLGEIACGTPIYANEDRESYVLADSDIKADCCLTARGDSMTGIGINDGDIVFIKRQDAVENGEVAAVIIGDEVTLKRVFFYPNNDMMILRAENPAFAEMVYSGAELSDVRIYGKALFYQSDIQ